jgi:hypothetical protein
MAEQGRVAPELRLCRACRRFVIPGPVSCDFCGADLDAAEAEHEARQEAVRRAADSLRKAMAAIERDA